MSLTAKQRAAIVRFNVGHNGLYNGSGYPGHNPNEACQFFHVGTTYSCAYGNSYAFAKVGPRLISMQPGMSTGYNNCGYGLAAARRAKAVIGSWVTNPADLIFVITGTTGQPGHTEMVIFRNSGPELQHELERILGIKLTAADDVMYTFGWDSGPSNVDRYHGQGGCHVHMWHVPKGVGNPTIMAAADASKLVIDQPNLKLPIAPKVTPAAHAKAAKHGPKGTPLEKTTDSKVVTVRTRLAHRTKAVEPGPSRRHLKALRAQITRALRIGRKAKP